MELRKDGWDVEADLFLAQTVLQHIESGSTQLKAFEEASEKLKRSKAACGFRWNGSLRKKYEDAIQEAKQIRNQNKSDGSIVTINTSTTATREPSSKEEEYTVQSHQEPIQLDQEFVLTFNEIMDNLSSHISLLRQMTIELAGRLEAANNHNEKLKSEYINLQNEIINAVDMNVFMRLADKISNNKMEQITG
ncbi:hypothetical protein [Paenibacillus illinoisensis]|uniref:hypothetical protein n=1 Tax=Paenibacillus illinoisensis TaxID=59845 RepID=UPI001C8D92FE|nr:hypothetical protein [Paenibacillus illinoisensis]MBY0217766.1 hypothetical protein [Paenibacillus illinoisensis]